MKTTLFASFLITSFFISSCVNQNKPEALENALPVENNSNTNGELSDKERLDKTKRIYDLLPSPIETSVLLKEAGVSFDSELLNKTEKAFDYRSSTAQALNLGIYGTDLSFASAYGQEQETVMYFAAAKKLSDDLHISKAFTEELMQKVEENINNKDILMRLISDAYWTANTELKENERATVSVLVLSGAWVEAMYIAVKVVNMDMAKTGIIQKLGEQKYSLHLLMELLNDQHDDRYIQEIYADFEKFAEIFNRLEYVNDPKEFTDPVTGDVNTAQLRLKSISKKDLADITATISTVRYKYVSME